MRALAKARRSGQAEVSAQLSAQIAMYDAHTLNLIALAFTAYFDLVNLAEEQHRVRILRERDMADPTGTRAESIARAFKEIKAQGVSLDQVAALVRAFCVSRSFSMVARAILSASRRACAWATAASRSFWMSCASWASRLVFSLGLSAALAAAHPAFSRAGAARDWAWSSWAWAAWVARSLAARA
ncbi:phosphoenolpyruvate carboxylase [Nitrosomonas sp.]|uniref:phosphoenolpyruvate carboxylase n=1 Tax=Nitrosomonas sp. TaxID=42353 RepID=UPI00345A1DFB